MSLPNHCILGALAPELIDEILFQVDSVLALRNFINAARFTYSRFQLRKAPILFRTLQNELGPVLMDAKFLLGFPYAEPGSRDNLFTYCDWIHTKTEVYRDMLWNGLDALDDAVPGLTELTQICHTLHEINFLTDTYLTAHRDLLRSKEGVVMPPSRTERQRLVRSFYRRQILCNAWAPTMHEARWMNEEVAAISNTSNHQGVRLGLFSIFEPWELQHIDHADHFVSRLCAALHLATEEAAADLVLNGPSLTVTRSIGQMEFGEMYSHADYLIRYMREHRTIAEAALHTLSLLPLHDPDTFKPSSMCRQFMWRYSLLCLQSSWQTFRLRAFPDPEKDHLEHGQEDNGRALVRFIGESVDQPPFGWVDALDGHYVNWFGDGLLSVPKTPTDDNEANYTAQSISLEIWRGSGFTFWDRQRVEGMKRLDRSMGLQTGWLLSWGAS
ncbi:hypothetical protein GQ53DRAFT_890241 [Thozetella sp. PMI_491]|nr:hypothetical protein GQ53DRAFT_890241 [Thozetella sp. PMI_491]